MSYCLCDKCGAEFHCSPHTRYEGDLEITYIQCEKCKEEYIVSITDSVLRASIDRYQRIAKTIADGKTSEYLVTMARKLMVKNHAKSCALREEYRKDKRG